jgi:hypothetical protein
MPPISPQGSRGGLITATVVFAVLSVTFAIFAIYFAVDDNKKTDQLTTQIQKSKQIYGDISSPRVQALLEERTRNPNREQTALAASIEDWQILADLIDGKNPAAIKTPSVVVDAAHDAMAKASSKLPAVNVTNSPTLLSAFNAVVDYAAGVQAQNQRLHNAQAEAAGDASKQIANYQALVQSAQNDLTAAVKDKQDALDHAQKIEDERQAAVKEMTLRMDQLQKNANVQMSQLQKTIDVKDTVIAAKQRANEALIDKLSLRRISVTDPILRQPDGYIESIASADVVYINLGAGAHIVPGMTFEVYDQRDGIPKQDDLMSEDSLPVGVASIEVQQVLSNGAQCRVIRTEIGQHIGQGDPIANLVYDRNTKYKFVVYGDFDLAQTGTPRPGDKQKIEALIKQWGGEIQKNVTADTDFVVMGKVPEVHSFPPEELADDPLVKEKQEEEKATYDAYEKVLDQAKELHIPFMNQNRFLYFCGYYDNALR